MPGAFETSLRGREEGRGCEREGRGRVKRKGEHKRSGGVDKATTTMKSGRDEGE